MKSLLCVLSVSLVLVLVSALVGQAHLNAGMRKEKPSSGRSFPTPAELRARVCKFDPEVCLMEAGKIPKPGTQTVPKQMRAIYEGLMEWAIEGAAFDFLGAEPGSSTTEQLQAKRRADPEKFWVEMVEYLKQHHPEVAGRYSGMVGEVAEGGLPGNPYWGFVPQFMGHALLDSNITFSTPCFSNVVVAIQKKTFGSNTDLEVAVTATGKSADPFCDKDRFTFNLGLDVHHLEVSTEGITTFPFDITLIESDPNGAWKWDLEMKGVRVFLFDKAETFRNLDLIATLLLFTKLVENKPVGGFTAKWNVDYLSNYTLIKPYPVPRASGAHRVNLTTGVDVRSGDQFAKMDLNGLGTTEMVGQGTTSGHVATAMRNMTSGEMMVCESVTSGIICTEYHQWTEDMQKMNLAIVMAPLADNLQQIFEQNLDKAWDFVNSVYGNEYGYHNFIFGWIDTAHNNYPCFPNAKGQFAERCLVYEHLEHVSFYLEALLPSVATTFVGEATNHRAKTKGLPLKDAFQQGFINTNLINGYLWAAIEEDHWNYTITNMFLPKGQTKQGPSMVCSTTGCNILRAGGVFDGLNGGVMQCAEIDVWDFFSLNIFEPSRMGANRPAKCVEADPTNQLCQITGTWTFNLNTDVNARTVVANISEHCATQNPFPYQREGCGLPQN